MDATLRDGGAGRTNEECRPRGSIPKSVQAPPPFARSSTPAPRTRAARSPPSILRAKVRGLARKSRRCPPAFSFVLTLREDASRLPTGKEGSLDLVRDVPYPPPLARCTFLSSSFRDTSGWYIREVLFVLFAPVWKNLAFPISGPAFLSFLSILLYYTFCTFISLFPILFNTCLLDVLH